MSIHMALRITTPTGDFTVFGGFTILRGSRLADALVQLRNLARSGLRSESEVEAEIAILIDNSKKEV